MKKLRTILISCIWLAIASADILQNPDFELPPSNWNASSAAFFPLNAASSIPGWTFDGTGQYVTAGDELSLPRNGHAILLGEDGKINQTFVANGEEMQYLLTFSLGRRAQSCTANASLVVSAPDSSAQFSLTHKYGKEAWEVYGHQLGIWGGGESVNLVIESQDIDADSNSTCWPVVDAVLLSTIGSLKQGDDNLLLNGGFELGPAFPDFSNEGVLLDSEPSLTESALQQWTVMGTVKYIDAKNFFVPEGKAAVEIVSGVSAGVQTAKQLNQGSNYNMEFMLGDANDSCSGDFIVGVAAGSSVQNFSIHSNGTGSAKKYSITFTGAGSSSTSISFQSYTSRQREDGVFCGPVIDGIVLKVSSGHRSYMHFTFLNTLLLVTVLKISELV
ncbi:Emb:.1 protein [Perilla frutescens var. hirtella]|uniref:Emb:.1 protein n=1 Tax=Perilla frutescens var. hirtella TaxID=608512 RepID=A0AAD4IYB3_PERFH|nr:Emb:.1 protein [Perilla frutescens var. hirtella]